ncbi:class I SAM-dependent methyltransferase [Candidatus Micrarchaeota archaeon]|jgi:2-polyprenyl-3-methyl-5-hydroxy-6-metoxy-1,4-benzoquinol methylase|nr:class I SAM-dependent methyltransferase [Candidatus Micrarchaeota archaeon]
MWTEEIEWVTKKIDKILNQNFKTGLDIGSESLEYRTKKQPWNQTFYDYLNSKNIQIKTMDIKKSTKPDYLHNIIKPIKIKDKFDIVLATHLLEHIPILELGKTVKNIEKLINKNGILIVSVPNNYPYHAFPIDNGWRPVPKELVKLFKGKVLATSIIETEHKLDKYKGQPNSRSSCVILKY